MGGAVFGPEEDITLPVVEAAGAEGTPVEVSAAEAGGISEAAGPRGTRRHDFGLGMGDFGLQNREGSRRSGYDQRELPDNYDLDPVYPVK